MNEAAQNKLVERKTQRRHRAPNGPGLFVTDLELAEHLGLPPRDARMMFAALDENPGSNFPPKQKFWGNRRYLPEVERWLEAQNQRKITSIGRRSA